MAPQTRLPGQPSLRRLVAREVIAWHNQHPLARPISRRDITGFGVVSLPFSPPAEAPAERPADGGLAPAPVSAPTAASTSAPPPPRRFPMFDDLSLIPGLGRTRVVALALAHGWESRPGLPEWPLRQVPVSVGWQEADARRLHLQVVALKRGRRGARRVLVGRPVAGQPLAHVLGQRLWSWPRVAATGALLGGLLLSAGGLAWWAWAQWRPAPAEVLAAQGPSPRAAAGPAAPNDIAPGAPVAPAASSAGPGLPGDPDAPTEGWPVPGALPPPSRGTDDIPWLPGAAPPAGDPRSAAPVTYGLTLPPSADTAAVQASVVQLQAALKGLGRSASGYRVDVAGTPEGDAVTLVPMPSPEEARRMMRLLAARGIAMSVVQF